MILENLLGLAAEAETAADRYETAAREAVRKLIAPRARSSLRCWSASSSPPTASPGWRSRP